MNHSAAFDGKDKSPDLLNRDAAYLPAPPPSRDHNDPSLGDGNELRGFDMKVKCVNATGPLRSYRVLSFQDRRSGRERRRPCDRVVEGGERRLEIPPVERLVDAADELDVLLPRHGTEYPPGSARWLSIDPRTGGGGESRGSVLLILGAASSRCVVVAHQSGTADVVFESRLAPTRDRGRGIRPARGLSNREIAEELVLSEAAAKTHVKRKLLKLDASRRVQAVVVAHEGGLVTLGDAAQRS